MNTPRNNGRIIYNLLCMHIMLPPFRAHRISPHFFSFGRNALSPETISLELPQRPLPHDHYAKHILSRLSEAHKQFSQIKFDIRRQQHEIHDTKACNLFHNAESLFSGVRVLAESIHFYTVYDRSMIFYTIVGNFGSYRITNFTHLVYFYVPSFGYNEPSYLGCTLVTNFTQHVLL